MLLFLVKMLMIYLECESLFYLISRKFTIDMLALTLDKMNTIKVILKNSPQHPLRVGYYEE